MSGGEQHKLSLNEVVRQLDENPYLSWGYFGPLKKDNSLNVREVIGPYDKVPMWKFSDGQGLYHNEYVALDQPEDLDFRKHLKEREFQAMLFGCPMQNSDLFVRLVYPDIPDFFPTNTAHSALTLHVPSYAVGQVGPILKHHPQAMLKMMHYKFNHHDRSNGQLKFVEGKEGIIKLNFETVKAYLRQYFLLSEKIRAPKPQELITLDDSRLPGKSVLDQQGSPQLPTYSKTGTRMMVQEPEAPQHHKADSDIYVNEPNLVTLLSEGPEFSHAVYSKIIDPAYLNQNKSYELKAVRTNGRQSYPLLYWRKLIPFEEVIIRYFRKQKAADFKMMFKDEERIMGGNGVKPYQARAVSRWTGNWHMYHLGWNDFANGDDYDHTDYRLLIPYTLNDYERILIHLDENPRLLVGVFTKVFPEFDTSRL